MDNKLFEDKIDAYVLLSEENRFYFTRFSSSFGCVVLTPNEKFFFTDFRYEDAARHALNDFTVNVVNYGELYSSVVAVLKKSGAKNVGYEENYITVGEFKKIKAAFEGFNLKPVSETFDLMRAVKTDREIELISNSAVVTQRALAKVLPLIKVGVSEAELSAEIMFEMIKNGADGLAFDNIVAFGENSAEPHHKPGQKKLEKNDLVLIDIGAKAGGYCADMTRTYCLGEPVQQLMSVYSAVLAAQNYALKNIRAGMTGHEADSLAREYLKSHGYTKEFGHSLGHGVGINVHEFPRVSRGSDTVLEENMVISVEPGVYIDGLGGVRIEDLVVVKKDGVVNLTTLSDKNLTLKI